MNDRPIHATVTLDHDGDRIDVDAQLAPLIGELWRRGVKTTGGCEGDWDEIGRAYVQFPSADDALRFLELVASPGDRDPRSLSQRMLGGMYYAAEEVSEADLWDVAAWPHAEGGPYGGRRGAAARFGFAVDVLFPSSDIAEITRRVTAAAVRTPTPISTMRRWEGGCEHGTAAGRPALRGRGGRGVWSRRRHRPRVAPCHDQRESAVDRDRP